MRERFRPAFLIGFASILNVAAGVVLKEAGKSTVLWFLLAGLAIAGLIGIGQFLLWSRAHQRYPLSLTYPFTGLTFPIALVVSKLYKEPVTFVHILATLLIAVGVIMVHRSRADLETTVA